VQEKGAASTTGTDYTKWDMWCPEDEEDELFNSLTPPECKAMEKDINDRHKRCAHKGLKRELLGGAGLLGRMADKHAHMLAIASVQHTSHTRLSTHMCAW